MHLESALILQSHFDFSSTSNEDDEAIIAQLREQVSQNEEERALLRQRLNEVEHELCNTLNDQTANLGLYEQQIESLMKERDGLLETLTEQYVKHSEKIFLMCFTLL